MKRALLAVALALAPCSEVLGAQPRAPIATAILDLDYLDTSGEAEDQTSAHARRLRDFREALGRDLQASGQYRIVTAICGATPCSSRAAPDEIRRAAQAAGAQKVISGGVHKMSTLVQWAKIEMIDVAQDRIAFDRLLTFRNDTDEAWRRAEAFTVDELLRQNAEAPRKKLAVFDFELEDFSGGAGLVAESADDREQLRHATQAARKILAQSGRYDLVDVSAAEAPPVPAKNLRNCDGCEAAMAQKFGADRSLIGIVTRITRTDYAVTYRLRDARDGRILSTGQTDLRIGASYSWDRGAAWLMREKFLAQQDQ